MSCARPLRERNALDNLSDKLSNMNFSVMQELTICKPQSVTHLYPKKSSFAKDSAAPGKSFPSLEGDSGQA